MKHPLTSKERRGLVAVAAAALLCIASGFIFRSCSPRHAPPACVRINDSVRSEESGKAEKWEESKKAGHKTEKSNRKGSRKGKKKAPERVYPVREPLDQPID